MKKNIKDYILFSKITFVNIIHHLHYIYNYKKKVQKENESTQINSRRENKKIIFNPP